MKARVYLGPNAKELTERPVRACSRRPTRLCGESSCTPIARTAAWILGNRVDGTQAEFARVPFADSSLCAIPAGADACETFGHAVTGRALEVLIEA